MLAKGVTTIKKEDTKRRILTEALRLFAQRGYDAVSVEQIANAVGIKAPSLYKHFPSKQSIFDALFERTEHDFDEFLSGISVHVGDAGGDMPVFGSMEADMLAGRFREMMCYLLHDEYVSSFRRMMTIEQFRSPRLSALYTDRYIGKLMDYHTEMFSKLAEAGVVDCGDPRAAAYMYCSPVPVLLGVCDRQPEKEAECLDILDRHVHLFVEKMKKRSAEEDKNGKVR